MKPSYRIAIVLVAIACISVIILFRPASESGGAADGSQMQPEQTPAPEQAPSAEQSPPAAHTAATSATSTPRAARATPTASVPSIVFGDTSSTSAPAPQPPAQVDPVTTPRPATAVTQTPTSTTQAPQTIVTSTAIVPTPAPTVEQQTRRAARTYTIQSGDTFSSIALKLYGKESRWVDLAQANPLVDPARIKVGQVIRLPNIDPAARQAADSAGDMRVTHMVTYMVGQGDTLTSIALSHYGDPNMWKVIYNTNRSVIGSSPSKLRPGMKLVIPPAPAPAR